MKMLTYVKKIIKSSGMRWTYHVVCMVEVRNTYKTVVRKPEGKTPLKKI
jgi:hypothetical protein